MEDRYRLLVNANVRNIKEYNAKFIERRLNPQKGHRFLPYIVAVVDEFADLIAVAGREIELPISRIAAKARAVGIHMILATQRPDTKVITGTIKSNFPSRIAFKVASMIDSRTILDAPGANRLIGRGDMLIVVAGQEPVRVQCAFVDTPEVEDIVAHGIASTVDEERVLIGSAHFVFEDESCIIPEGEQERFDALPPEYSHLYLAVGGQLAAVICISDPLREEAKEVLSALRALGITSTVMLTGDSRRTAEAIALQVGVDAFRAEVLPADKADYVARLRREGHTVLMVGDGINDSPALSEADAGIAISDGAAIAREIADITIAADSLWELVELRRIAMALMARIHSNYRFVIGFNGTLIALGVAGVLPPATSATLHNLSTLGVSLRSMGRLAAQTQSARGNNSHNG